MANQKRPKTGSLAAGLSGGTGFAGLVLLMPDGVWKSILVVLSPSITLIISMFWREVTDEIGAQLAFWKIRRELKGATAMFKRIQGNPHLPVALRDQAYATVNSIVATEVALRKKRAESVLKDQP